MLKWNCGMKLNKQKKENKIMWFKEKQKQEKLTIKNPEILNKVKELFYKGNFVHEGWLIYKLEQQPLLQWKEMLSSEYIRSQSNILYDKWFSGIMNKYQSTMTNLEKFSFIALDEKYKRELTQQYISDNKLDFIGDFEIKPLDLSFLDNITQKDIDEFDEWKRIIFSGIVDISDKERK